MKISLNIWDVFPLATIAFLLIFALVATWIYRDKFYDAFIRVLRKVYRKYTAVKKSAKKRTYKQRRAARNATIRICDNISRKAGAKADRARVQNVAESFERCAEKTCGTCEYFNNMFCREEYITVGTNETACALYLSKDGDAE